QVLELTAPMSVVIAPLGVRLRPVRLAPAAREVEHRGLYPLEQVQAAPLRGFRQAAALRQAEDVDVVLARRGGGVDEARGNPGLLALVEEEVGERGVPPAEKRRHLEPVAPVRE